MPSTGSRVLRSPTVPVRPDFASSPAGEEIREETGTFPEDVPGLFGQSSGHSGGDRATADPGQREHHAAPREMVVVADYQRRGEPFAIHDPPAAPCGSASIDPAWIDEHRLCRDARPDCDPLHYFWLAPAVSARSPGHYQTIHEPGPPQADALIHSVRERERSTPIIPNRGPQHYCAVRAATVVGASSESLKGGWPCLRRLTAPADSPARSRSPSPRRRARSSAEESSPAPSPWRNR